jgi:hypothetical protein
MRVGCAEEEWDRRHPLTGVNCERAIRLPAVVAPTGILCSRQAHQDGRCACCLPFQQSRHRLLRGTTVGCDQPRQLFVALRER